MHAHDFVFLPLICRWLAEEIDRNLPVEMNFVHEAANRDRAAALSTRADVSFPAIYAATPRVLVMEFADGVRINDVQGMIRLGVQPAAVAQLLAEVFAEQVRSSAGYEHFGLRSRFFDCMTFTPLQAFVHGFVHCDPHPGNVLVQADARTRRPRLVMLDHGLYRELSNEFRLNYCQLWRSLILGDVAGIRTYSAKMNAGDAYPLFAAMLTYKVRL